MAGREGTGGLGASGRVSNSTSNTYPYISSVSMNSMYREKGACGYGLLEKKKELMKN